MAGPRTFCAAIWGAVFMLITSITTFVIMAEKHLYGLQYRPDTGKITADTYSNSNKVSGIMIAAIIGGALFGSLIGILIGILIERRARAGR